MSLVLGYASKENAIIMSDGRAGGTVSQSEVYDKTRKINNNIIIGFVGYKETCEHFLKCVSMDMGNKIDKCHMDDFLKEIKFGMWLPATRKNLKSTFMIIGKSENGDMASAIAGESTKYRIEKNLVSDARILCIGGSVDGNIINDIYIKNIFGKNMSIEDCMRKTIEEVSEIDETVNKEIFYKFL